jgi:hypothetical protein
MLRPIAENPFADRQIEGCKFKSRRIGPWVGFQKPVLTYDAGDVECAADVTQRKRRAYYAISFLIKKLLPHTLARFDSISRPVILQAKTIPHR